MTTNIVAIIRRFDRPRGWRAPSQGELRDLRDAGYAIEHPDHSFTLTEAGRTILRMTRHAAQEDR